MRRAKALAVGCLALAAAGLLTSLIGPAVMLACRGNMAWRFMPPEQALKERARIAAELKTQALNFHPIEGSIEFDKWIKYYDNPVFKPGPKGSWEEYSVDCFTIGYYGGQYMMWYVGTPAASLSCQIGLATSPDGINWTKHPDNPVIRLGSRGEWDSTIIICQSVLFDKEEKVFKMWYLGGNAGIFGVGLAYSLDGIKWTKYKDIPVIRITEPWEGMVLEAFTVLKMKDGYKIWFGGNDLDRDKASIGYAVSPDGIHWTKHPANPIFKTDAAGKWDSYSVSDPDIIYRDGLYHMWYKGWAKKGGKAWIGHATSLGGISWTRDPENPVLITSSLPGSWETYEVYRPRVITGKASPIGPSTVIDRLWYSGRTYDVTAQIGLAYQFAQTGKSGGAAARIPDVNQDRMEMVADAAPDGAYNIGYFTPWLGNVYLTVYSPFGQKVRTLVRSTQLAGFYNAVWDGRDNEGRPLEPGLYYLELKDDYHVLTREIVKKK